MLLLQLALTVGSSGIVFGVAASMPLPGRLQVESSTVLRYGDGSPAHVFLAPDERWRIHVPVEDVDPDYLDALIRLEDKRFATHPGIDGLAILRAAHLNLKRREVVSGASTITMQLVRMVEPRPRTLRAKAIEALRALQLELVLSKREILEAYLQFVPYGRNVEGVEAGALAYFGHTAKALSPGEIATLLAVPQNPNRRYPTATNQERLRAARDQIALRLAARGAMPLGPEGGRITAQALVEMVRASPLPEGMRSMPRQAHHAAEWMRSQGSGPQLHSTLDRGLQKVVERQLEQERPELFRKGIHNAAVVVIDHATMELRALAGGFDFWDAEHSGQIPAFAVPRSPGSSLKPFIYALALDRGDALPGFLVRDVPHPYSGYNPNNYDGRFEGLVRLEDALSRSRNLPFVELLQGIGVERFLASLRQMGAESLNPQPGHYGLSAAIGGIELTPLEMAVLYATLARGGRYNALGWTAMDLASGAAHDPNDARIFGEGAAHLTRRALSIRDRPDFPSRRDLASAPPDIHWKTGTSGGHRDAWAIGSNTRYSVAVWLGNLNNEASIHLVGADAAGPLLFDLLEAMADPRRRWSGPQLPRELSSIEVCAYSGHVPTLACPQRRKALALTHSVPPEPCPYHVQVEVDVDTGHAVRPGCREDRRTELRSYLSWPASVRRWLSDGRHSLPEPPALAANCRVPVRGAAPRIVSPVVNQVALLLEGLPAESQSIPLEAEADAEVRLSWFIDGEYIGSASAEDRLWWTPHAGEHELLVQDDHGRSSRQTLDVRSRY
jgi:penicillin-binding protein 1C